MSKSVFWDVTSLLFQLRAMEVVHALYPWGQFDRITSAVARLPLGSEITAMSDRDGWCPAFVLVRCGRHVGFFCTGVTTLQDGLGMFYSSSSDPVSYKGVNISRIVQQSAARYSATLHKQGVGEREHLVAVGHSYGACLASALAFITTSSGGVPNTDVLGFGGPRFADERFREKMGRVRNVRVMCADDPVPRFTPYPSEAPTAYDVLPAKVTDPWTQWKQCGDGYVIYEGGNVSKEQLPPLVLPIQDAHLLEWAVSPYGISGARHAGFHYVRRLQQAVTRQIDQEAAKGESVSPKPPVPLPIVGIAAGSVFDQVCPPLPPSKEKFMTGRVVPTFLAYKQRVGADWVVIWCDRIVFTGKSRSNAGTMAAKLNAFLRRLVAVKAIFTAATLASLQFFISELADGVVSPGSNVVVNP